MERRDYANALKVSLISSHPKKNPLKSKMAPIYWAANHLLSNKTNAQSILAFKVQPPFEVRTFVPHCKSNAAT
jgi:hypothetical protein